MKTLVFSFVGLVFCFSVVSFGEETTPAEKSANPETATSAPAASTKPSSEKTFSGDAATLKTHMDDLFDWSKKVNEEAKVKAQARGKIETALDWDRVAQDCLGEKQWKKQSAKNLADFKSLLKDVIVRTAYSRMDSFWKDGTSYTFDQIDVKGSDAHVAAKFNIKNDNFVLEYFLAKKNNKWLIRDISFESIRYSENIREQIEAFLKEKPFTALLEKLKKRRNELESKPAKG